MQLNRNIKWNGTLLLVAAIGLSTLSIRAQTIEYKARPGGSKAVVAGDSSIHAWTMETGIIGGTMIADKDFPESALKDPAAAKPETSVYVPVRTLKSGKEKMDERMLDTMKGDKYPKFEYKLIELKPVSKPGDTGPLKFNAVGALTIVGKTITNTMPVTIEKAADGKLKVVGSTPLKLTQFEIPPPTISLPLLPDIKVYDDLKVDFEWTLAPRPAKKAEAK